MELNPYQSPRVPQPLQDQEAADADSVRQLLVEIRNGQRELLALHREAMKHQQAFGKFRPVAMALPLVFMAISFGFLFYVRSTPIRPPMPVRTAPVAMPPLATPPVTAPAPRKIP